MTSAGEEVRAYLERMDAYSQKGIGVTLGRINQDIQKHYSEGLLPRGVLGFDLSTPDLYFCTLNTTGLYPQTIRKLFGALGYNNTIASSNNLRSPKSVYSLLLDAANGSLDEQIKELQRKLTDAKSAQELAVSIVETTLKEKYQDSQGSKEFIRNLRKMIEARLPLDNSSQIHNNMARLRSVKRLVDSNPGVGEKLRELDLSLVPEYWSIETSGGEAERLRLPEHVLYIPRR